MDQTTLQDYGGPAETPIEREIADMAPWFHNLHLPDGSQTAPRHPLGDFPRIKWEALARALPEDLSGWSALDIGCNAGFYSFALAKRGAAVFGIDSDERYLRQARWARARLGLDQRVRLDRYNIYELATIKEKFDLVLFQGVFYHLRYPLLGLDLAASRCKRLLVFQSLTVPESASADIPADLPMHRRETMVTPAWPKMWFVEHSLAGDSTNWWVPNPPAMEAMIRSAGLEILGRPGEETYLCRPSDDAGTRSKWLAAVRDSFSPRQG